MNEMVFPKLIKNRTEAGRILAEKIDVSENSIVLAIPRGRLIIGNEIAKKLKYPLDIVISKKITPPEYPEYAIGAITPDVTIYKSKDWKFYLDSPGFREELENKKKRLIGDF